jgi:S1-C subfamily serine protease
VTLWPPGVSASRTKIPPEFSDEAALLGHLKLSQAELKKIWWFRGRMYRQFEIGKTGSKARRISAPDKRLKHLQRQIARLLDGLYRVRYPVHGFVANKSVKTNAQAHLRKRFVLNLDVKDFFPAITEGRIAGLLRSIGMDSRVADIIARLCTNDGRLPQGAPTSPVLSNMICFRLDKQLMTFAKDNRCIYTRYADDITFSSEQPMAALFEGTVPSPGRFPPDLLAPRLRAIFLGNGFEINADKTHYADRHSRRMVTGLKVNELINVDRRYVRNIRAALYSVRTLGAEDAQKKFETDLGGKADLGAHLAGKISWLRFIRGQSDPVFRVMALRFNAAFPDRKIDVVPTRDEVRDRAVWVVDNDSDISQGSAFFLKGVGLVTAAHCAKGAKEVEVYHPSKRNIKFKASVAKRDEKLDLAILSHTIPATEYYELERSFVAVAVGSDLTAIGYPDFGPGDGLNVREGKVSSLPVKNDVSMIEVTQKLSQGMSGGPLLDGNDAVVGVTHKGGPDEGRDFAVCIEMIDKI